MKREKIEKVYGVFALCLDWQLYVKKSYLEMEGIYLSVATAMDI
jgi:hypothetical protein